MSRTHSVDFVVPVLSVQPPNIRYNVVVQRLCRDRTP